MLADLLGPHEWLGWSSVTVVAVVVLLRFRRLVTMAGVAVGIGALLLANQGVLPLPGM